MTEQMTSKAGCTNKDSAAKLKSIEDSVIEIKDYLRETGKAKTSKMKWDGMVLELSPDTIKNNDFINIKFTKEDLEYLVKHDKAIKTYDEYVIATESFAMIVKVDDVSEYFTPYYKTIV